MDLGSTGLNVSVKIYEIRARQKTKPWDQKLFPKTIDSIKNKNSRETPGSWVVVLFHRICQSDEFFPVCSWNIFITIDSIKYPTKKIFLEFFELDFALCFSCQMSCYHETCTWMSFFKQLKILFSWASRLITAHNNSLCFYKCNYKRSQRFSLLCLCLLPNRPTKWSNKFKLFFLSASNIFCRKTNDLSICESRDENVVQVLHFSLLRSPLKVFKAHRSMEKFLWSA